MAGRGRWGFVSCAVLALAIGPACGAGDSTRGDRDEHRIRAALNVCPEYVEYRASPLQASLNGKITINVLAEDTDQDELSYAWEAPSGCFSTPDSADTSYTCNHVGQQNLRLTTTDGSCLVDLSIPVHCVEWPSF
jgi:hypothetical protein